MNSWHVASLVQAVLDGGQRSINALRVRDGVWVLQGWPKQTKVIDSPDTDLPSYALLRDPNKDYGA